MNPYSDALNPNVTPQSEPIPGQEAKMEKNHAGGFTFVVDDWTRLDRFLILGSDAPTYYATSRALTKENAACVGRCLALDGPRVVARVVEVSDAGRAPKNDPAILALAMALKTGDDPTKKAAEAAVPKVCRIGTHLFTFTEFIELFGGWGRATKRAVQGWYTAMDEAQLALQAIKYQQRNGWSHRDVLRLCKPPGHDPASTRGAIFHWMTKGWPDIGDAPHPDNALRTIWAFERAKTADTDETIRLIREYRLPRECVRTDLLGIPTIWAALLEHMPMHALVRNLGKMTAVGLLGPLQPAVPDLVRRLSDQDTIRKSRLHPFTVLVALRAYAAGKGEKGHVSWTPNQKIVDALDSAFYAAFQNVTPTGKRFLLALDVSGSMASPELAGMVGITPRVASCAMAMVTAAVEPQTHLVAFTAGANGYGGKWGGDPSELTELRLSPGVRLDHLIQQTAALPMGGTDCSLPMLYAEKNGIPVDCFVVLTDNETWHGDIHPMQALRQYRKAMGIPAKLVVVAMTATEFSIADATDGGCLDVVGLDSATPALVSSFAAS